MYIPKVFEMKDPQEIYRFVKQNSFGTLVSTVEGKLFATHIPILMEQREGGSFILKSHVAKANPQWKELQDREVLVMFTGPHAYVSHKWYEEHQSVSTWNYTAVHMYGQVRLIEDEQEFYTLLAQTTEFYGEGFDEAPIPSLDDRYIQGMMKSIVGFEVEVSEVEAKYKLNQNQSKSRQEKIMAQLEQQNFEDSQHIARLIKKNLT
ncbi:MAG: FMN-binding negative transcriptional regulator [Solibacillus sp.]